MKKIGILDISKNSHHTYLDCLINILSEDEINLYISSFLNNSLKKTIREKDYDKIKKITKIDKIEFLGIFKLIKEINSSDIQILFINTLQNNWIFYLLVTIFLKKKIVLSIHNINAFYKCPSSIKGFFRFIIRKIVAKKSSYINVYGENMKNYLTTLEKEKKITTLPFSFYKDLVKINFSEKKSKFKIVIPGGFEERRRDYSTIYEGIKKFESEVELIILGRLTNPNSLELFEKFKALKNVKTYESFIDEIEFENQMRESDLILGPTQKFIEFEKGIKEEYGLTKETGFTFAQITYAKPGITPHEIIKMKELENSTVSYKNSEDFVNILEKLIKDKSKLNELKANAIKNSENFTKEKIRLKFEKEIGEL